MTAIGKFILALITNLSSKTFRFPVKCEKLNRIKSRLPKIFKICYFLDPKNGCAFFITDVFVTVLGQFDNGEYDKVGYINFESSKIAYFVARKIATTPKLYYTYLGF